LSLLLLPLLILKYRRQTGGIPSWESNERKRERERERGGGGKGEERKRKIKRRSLKLNKITGDLQAPENSKSEISGLPEELMTRLCQSGAVVACNNCIRRQDTSPPWQ